MSSTETESTNPEHAPASGVVDPKNAPDEESLLHRLGEQTEFNNRKPLIFFSRFLFLF